MTIILNYLFNDNFRIFRILLIGTLFLFLALIPIEILENTSSICIFKNLFHHERFGCGMTRAISSILHFKFTTAFYYNKLVIVVFPILFIILLKDIFTLLQSTFIKYYLSGVTKD